MKRISRFKIKKGMYIYINNPRIEDKLIVKIESIDKVLFNSDKWNLGIYCRLIWASKNSPATSIGSIKQYIELEDMFWLMDNDEVMVRML